MSVVLCLPAHLRVSTAASRGQAPHGNASLPSYWKKRVEDEEKKRAKKRLAVRIMSPEDQHHRIMEYFWRNLGEPDRMISMKNSVYVEVFGDTAGGRLLRLDNVEWIHGEKLRMQMIPARMSLDSLVQYVSVELKLNCKNEAHIKDRHGNGNRERRDDRNYCAIQEDPTVGQRPKSRSRVRGWNDVVWQGVHDSGRS